MTNEVFLDTAFVVALAAPSDQLHDKAIELRDQMKAQKTRIVTTQAVLLEIGNALSKVRYRAAAVTTLSALHADSQVTIVALSQELYAKAFDLFRGRMDKEWGLIDCVSFVVMSEKGLTEALTSDDHFEQAGFMPLLYKHP